MYHPLAHIQQPATLVDIQEAYYGWIKQNKQHIECLKELRNKCSKAVLPQERQQWE